MRFLAKEAAKFIFLNFFIPAAIITIIFKLASLLWNWLYY
jgi:hypothetical protein